MSKITSDGLIRSDTGCFIAVAYPYGNSGRQRVKLYSTDDANETPSPDFQHSAVVL